MIFFNTKLFTFLRVLLGCIFIVSGALKIISVDSFFHTLSSFGYFPFLINKFLSYLIPLFELSLGLLLIIGFWSKITTIISSILLLVFIGAILPQLFIENSIDCGCFGIAIEEKIDILLLFRNLVLLGISTIVCAFENKYISFKFS